MKIQLIGGSGFVGSRLISDYGTEKFENLDKNKSIFFNNITRFCDITKPSSIKLNPKCSTVILLAAEHADNVKPISLYYDVNVNGTKNVLEKMDEVGIKKLIFTSSVAVYGLNKDNPNENHKVDPFNHYGKSKFEAEKIIRDWFNNDPKNKSVTIIRPTVIFGENNRGNIYNLLKQISRGRFIMIGKGKNKKSMAYVGNVSSFINCIINNRDSGFNVYNYSDKPDFTMNEIVFLIRANLGIKNFNFFVPYPVGLLAGYFFDFMSFIFRKKFSISSVRIKKFTSTTRFDSKRALSFFTPPVKLDDAMKITIDYEFKNNS